MFEDDRGRSRMNSPAVHSPQAGSGRSTLRGPDPAVDVLEPPQGKEDHREEVDRAWWDPHDGAGDLLVRQGAGPPQPRPGPVDRIQHGRGERDEGTEGGAGEQGDEAGEERG